MRRHEAPFPISIPLRRYVEMSAEAMDWTRRAEWIFAQSTGIDYEQVRQTLNRGRQLRAQGIKPSGYLRAEFLDLLQRYEQTVGDNVKKYVQGTGGDKNSIDQAIDAYYEEKDRQEAERRK